MPAQVRSRLSQTPVISEIRAQLDNRPLPILRKTVGRVVALASREQTDIGEVAQTILQDESFSAKVLAVSNGAYYRNRAEPITSVTRAVVQVGYNTIRNIAVAAEFVDMAEQRLPPGVSIYRLLAKSLVAAHQAKALGDTINLREPESLFTASQLQNIGVVALALYLPKEFKKIEELVDTRGMTYEVAHHQVLNLSPEELAEGVMELCGLPQEFATKAPKWAESSIWTEETRRNAAVVFANRVADNLFAPQTEDTIDRMNDLIDKGAKAFGVPAERLQRILTEAFHTALSLGKGLGVHPDHFSPRVPHTAETPEQAVHGLVASCMASEPTSQAEEAEAAKPAEPDAVGSASLLVNFLKDLTAQVMTGNDFNAVVTCVLEGLHRAVGFDHSIVLLMVPGKPLAVGRYGLGPDAPNLLSSFVVATDSEHDLLAHCMATRTTMRFNPLDNLPLPLPPGIMDLIQPAAVAIGSLHLPSHPVGLIWADRMTGTIDDAMWNSFQLFMMQANLALLRLSIKR
ncbi:MAG: HDOD domain-containing protein [Nitrospirales bacterium]